MRRYAAQDQAKAHPADQFDNSSTSDRIMLDPEVKRVTGLSSSTRWREIREKRFPQPIPISRGRRGWLQSEIEVWLAQRIAARNTREVAA